MTFSRSTDRLDLDFLLESSNEMVHLGRREAPAPFAGRRAARQQKSKSVVGEAEPYARGDELALLDFCGEQAFDVVCLLIETFVC